MKPFLGVDLTKDKRNEQFHGEEFLTLTPSDALSESLESSSEKAKITVERAKLPLLFRVIECICGIASPLLAYGILRASGSLT